MRFAPDEANVSLLSRSGQAAVTQIEPYGYGYYYQRGLLPLYTPLCDGPCTMRMAPGTYDMALSKGGGGAVPAHTPVVIQGPSTMEAEYVDKSGLRVLGTVIGIAGTIGGTIMIIASVHTHTDFCDINGNCFGHTDVEGGLMAGGIAVLVGSIVVGSILGLQHDSAHIHVTPLALAPTGRRMEMPQMAQGAALTLDF